MYILAEYLQRFVEIAWLCTMFFDCPYDSDTSLKKAAQTSSHCTRTSASRIPKYPNIETERGRRDVPDGPSRRGGSCGGSAARRRRTSSDGAISGRPEDR